VGGESFKIKAFQLEEGETMVILARTIEARLNAHTIGGMPVAVIDS